MMMRNVVLLAGLCGALLATVAMGQGQQAAERMISRSDWERGARAARSAKHDVVVAVQQSNLEEVERILYEVSDPRSAKYGQHLDWKQVAQMTENKEATEAVVRFAQEHGLAVMKTSKHGEYVTLRGPVPALEEAFGMELFEYRNRGQHPAGGLRGHPHHMGAEQRILRAQEYHMPAALEGHVAAVFNTVQLPPRMRPGPMAANVEDTTTGVMTPQAIYDYYNVDSNVGSEAATISVFETGQVYSPDDLSDFQTQFDLDQDAVDDVIGGHESSAVCDSPLGDNLCIEANLDVQYMMALSTVSPMTYYYSGDLDAFLSWAQGLVDMENPPLVNSVSYGSVEPELPSTVAEAFNVEAMKLGVRGVTILVSSGDDGVANFQARSDASACGYNPSFPATSPFVTAVGATQGPEFDTTEIACQSDEGGLITTGGGFSTIFSTPEWQASTVSAYFDNLSSDQTPASGYNTQGRAYPDVSLVGHNYDVIVGGEDVIVSGTSASAPTVGGMVSLVNADRLSSGKSSLGFLNMAIYQNVDIFNDITSGENNCCAGSSDQVCCSEGFYATTGWDPLTGAGSVDYATFSSTFGNF